MLERNAAVADETARLPDENVEILRSSLLLGILVPEEDGGVGATLGEFATIATELGGACASTAMAWAMHCQQVDAIVRHANGDLRTRVLRRIAAGDILIGSITTEEGTGGSLLAADAPLVSHEDRVRVDRHAPIVTAARLADAFLVTMRTDASAAPHNVSLVYVDRNAADVTVEGGWNPMGMRGTESLAIHLRADVGPVDVVGAPGRFSDVVHESFAPLAHIGWAAVWLGAARSAYCEVVEDLRSSPRASVLTSDLAAARLGEARSNLETVAAMLASVVQLLAGARRDGRSVADAPSQMHINALKTMASKLLLASVNDLLDIAGIRGYIRVQGRVLERVVRDLRSAPLNYRDDRLLIANGRLSLMDRGSNLTALRALTAETGLDRGVGASG